MQVLSCLHMLSARRNARGWSQEELAHRAGISVSAVQKIENNADPNPRLETIRKLCSALECAAEEIFPRIGK